MTTTQQKALNTVRYLRLAPSRIARLRHERTMNIVLPKEAEVWPSSVVAQYYLRLALENACTKIRVHKGVHSKQEYDVMTLVKVTRYLSLGGVLSRPKWNIPANFATAKFAAMGEVLDTTRPYAPVGINLKQPVSGTPVLTTGTDGR